MGSHWIGDAKNTLYPQIDEDNIMMSRYIFNIPTETIKDLGCDF